MIKKKDETFSPRHDTKFSHTTNRKEKEKNERRNKSKRKEQDVSFEKKKKENKHSIMSRHQPPNPQRTTAQIGTHIQLSPSHHAHVYCSTAFVFCTIWS